MKKYIITKFKYLKNAHLNAGVVVENDARIDSMCLFLEESL